MSKKVMLVTAAVIGLLLLGQFMAGQKKTPQVCFEKACVNVEIVSKQEDLNKGLGGREKIAADAGMLFVFEKDGKYRFWMKGMKFPLDIIFLDKDLKVIYIAQNLTPCEEGKFCQAYGPSDDVHRVLEVNAQFTTAQGIKVGSTATFKNIP